MQKSLFFLIAFTLITLAACSKKDAAELSFKLNTPFSLDQGSTRSWDENADVQVRFDRVVGDSRCPVDAICVWAGRAEVEVTFIQPGSSVTDTLLLGDFSGSTKTNQATFGQYSLQLLKVLPNAYAGVEIPQEDYTVELVVKKSQ